MAVLRTQTTQELGVPVTEEQNEKLFMLYDLGVIDPIDWLNPYDYPSDIVEAKHKFDERFAFFDMLTLNPDSADNLSLVKVSVLWHDFMDYCACHPSVLLNRKRYSEDINMARGQLQERIASYDLYKSPTGCYGELRSGKTGWVCVHCWHGKEWFDLPIVVYKSRYNEEAFGDYTYLNEEKLLIEVEKVTKLVDQGKARGPKLEWDGNTEEARRRTKLDLAEHLHLRGAVIVYDESHKIVAKDHRTLLSSFIKDINAEWGHYRCQPIYITPRLQKLDKEGILADMQIEMGVSRSYTEPDTSIVQIIHRVTGDRKPLIKLYRRDYYPLWTHDALISSRSLMTAKDVRRVFKDQHTKEGHNGTG